VRRYLLFGGNCYYPSGGWVDFQGAFDSIEEAMEYEKTIDSQSYEGDWWWHVVDQTTAREVARGDDAGHSIRFGKAIKP
jgi:hypothetical protein